MIVFKQKFVTFPILDHHKDDILSAQYVTSPNLINPAKQLNFVITCFYFRTQQFFRFNAANKI